MNNLLCREEREKCSYDAGRKEWLGGRHVESDVQRRAKNDMKVVGGIVRTCALGVLKLWHTLEKDTRGTVVAAYNE